MAQIDEYIIKFKEQAVNASFGERSVSYDSEDETVLLSLFEQLALEVFTTGEDGESDTDSDLVDALEIVIHEYLSPAHFAAFREIVKEMFKESADGNYPNS